MTDLIDTTATRERYLEMIKDAPKPTVKSVLAGLLAIAWTISIVLALLLALPIRL